MYNIPEKGHPSVGEGIFIRASAQKSAAYLLLEFHLSPARPQISSFILLNLWKDQVPDYFVGAFFNSKCATRLYKFCNFFFLIR